MLPHDHLLITILQYTAEQRTIKVLYMHYAIYNMKKQISSENGYRNFTSSSSQMNDAAAWDHDASDPR